jgi:hypothetical protein
MRVCVSRGASAWGGDMEVERKLHYIAVLRRVDSASAPRSRENVTRRSRSPQHPSHPSSHNTILTTLRRRSRSPETPVCVLSLPAFILIPSIHPSLRPPTAASPPASSRAKKSAMAEAARIQLGRDAPSSTFHWLPCKIDHNGAAEVDEYFAPSEPSLASPSQPGAARRASASSGSPCCRVEGF